MRKVKHGESIKKSRTPEYRIWSSMKSRCNNPNNYGYKNYGGRGIKVCPEWNDNYNLFLEDMGRRTDKNFSIERIDNNGNYCKENCKWVHVSEQSRNRRTSVIFNGETATRASIRLGGCRHLIQRRIRIGWPIDLAFTIPAKMNTKEILFKLFKDWSSEQTSS